MALFLSEEEFREYAEEIFKHQISLVLTDTYNEFELKKTIDLIGKEYCGAIALQLAIVGYGNRTYGSVTVNGEKIDIKAFFDEKGIKYNLDQNTKLKPSDLTPRRLIRFFRYTVMEYLEKNQTFTTYLYKKYCINKNESNRKIVFPGYEHLADPRVDGTKIGELLLVYDFLDKRLNTKIKDRIIRVLIARGFNLDQINQNLL